MKDPKFRENEELQRDSRFSKVRDIEVGQTFKSRRVFCYIYQHSSSLQNRKACYDAGSHKIRVADIHGISPLGAFSVVLSNVYEDDFDEGEKL